MSEPAAHRGRLPDAACPACAPILAAARAAAAEWIRQQLRARRGSAAYRNARQAVTATSADLLATKQEHYATEA